MAKIINFSDLKKAKQEKIETASAPQNDTSISLTPTNTPMTTDGKYIMLEGYEIGFAGAFTRDILKNLSKNLDIVTDTVNKYYTKQRSLLKMIDQVSKEEKFMIDKGLEEANQMTLELAKLLKTEEQVDLIFDKRSLELLVIPTLFLTTMYVSYTEFDYQRMLRDRWFSIDASLTEFLEVLHEVYGTTELN